MGQRLREAEEATTEGEAVSFDVDILKEARQQSAPFYPSDPRHAPIFEAVDLMVAGQSLWWCEEHRCSVIDGWDKCAYHGLILRDTGEPTLHPCVLVEWWLSPTGPSPAKPTCSHGFNKPHSVGGTTNFHYDVATVCDEWVVERGLATDKLKVSPTGKDET